VSPVEVHLGELAARALAAADSTDAERLSVLLPQAVRFYLDERDGGQPSWRYPSFLDGGAAAAPGGCEVSLDEELWQQLRAEADRQAAPAEDLLQHAAFYYGAARDDGRLTERIAAELQREEEPDRPQG
jgi:hypothetical protein